MTIPRAELRQQLEDLRNTRSTGANFDAKYNRAINMALRRIAQDLPRSLLPSDEHVVAYTDVVSTDATVAASMAAWVSDDLVMEIQTDGGAALSTSSQAWRPAVNGTWDGVMHLEIKDADGVWRRRQSLEWWSETDGDTRYFVTLDRPWLNTTDTLLEFRIHQPWVFLGPDVLEVLDPARIWDESRTNVHHVHPSQRDSADLKGYRGDSKGPPEYIWQDVAFKPGQRGSFSLRVPSTAPTITKTGTWVGPEQEGTFTFLYTYVWGKRDFEWGENPAGGIYDPVWESPPSPASAEHVASGNTKIRITCRNPDEELGFAVAGSKRETRSGYRVRIYVARTAVDTTGNGSYDLVDPDGIYYLLTEIDPQTLSPVAAYDWDGSAIPDRRVRLYRTTGYIGYRLSPAPDQRYEIDFRVYRMPSPLEHDQDVVPLKNEVFATFVELCLYYTSLIDGLDTASARDFLDRYEEWVGNARQSDEQPAKSIPQVPFGYDPAPREIYGPFTG